MIRYPVSYNGGQRRHGKTNESSAVNHSNPLPHWRPDVYVHSFVPEAFAAINKCPALTVTTNPVDEIDFQKYVNTLYGQNFQKPMPIIPLPQVGRPSSVDSNSSNQRTSQNYGQYLMRSLASEAVAQAREVKNFDIFGARLEVLDRKRLIFTAKVSGLREDTPSVKYGHHVFLRQWVEWPTRSYNLGIYGWLPISSSRPGFTGYELNAVVVGVDNINETLHIRAFGMIEMPQIKCNIMFDSQPNRSFQLAVSNVAGQLQKTAINSLQELPVEPDCQKECIENCDWLESMLFPKEEHGLVQDGLPSINFAQNWIDLDLNYEQRKAVNAVTTANYGQLCYLINGPPGTGKTKTIVESVIQLGKNYDLQGSILLCAPSNQAADTLALRLKEHFHPAEMLRLNHFSRTFAEVPMDLMLYCFIEENIFSLPPIDRLMKYCIVITTCQDADLLVQARVTNRDLFNLYRDMTETIVPRQKTPSFQLPPLHWSALIIDEAAQATEPESLIPLSVVAPPPPPSTLLGTQPLFVMAGDQHQLGPRTYDKTTDLHISLFERLSKDPVYANHPLARNKMRSIDAKPKRMLCPPFANLTRNYRSHPAILAVPSSLFYSNTLTPEATGLRISSEWHKWSLHKPGWPVHFMSNGGGDKCEEIQDSTTGWYNEAEAQKAVGCAQNLLEKFAISDQSEICIMAPFRAQVRVLRKIARERNLHGLNIGPIEAFQGMEKRIVIICTTRARRRFLVDDKARGAGVIGEPKKFNVAITRAKEGLVVIGNPWVLATDPCWSAFLNFCWRNDLFWKDSVTDIAMEDMQEEMVNDWEPKQTTEAGNGVSDGGLESALLFKEKVKLEEPNAKGRLLGFDENEQWRSGVEAEKALEELDDLALGSQDEQEESDGSA